MFTFREITYASYPFVDSILSLTLASQSTFIHALERTSSDPLHISLAYLMLDQSHQTIGHLAAHHFPQR